MINGKPSDPSSKTFIQPKLTPPVHGNKVAEPLMSEFMGYNVGYPIAITICRRRRIEEDSGSSRSLVSMFL